MTESSKAIAVSSSQRSYALPNVPTTIEAGFPNSEYNFWIGVFAPSQDTDAPILERLHKEIAAALANPAVAERLAKLGADPMTMSAERFPRADRRREIVGECGTGEGRRDLSELGRASQTSSMTLGSRRVLEVSQIVAAYGLPHTPFFPSKVEEGARHRRPESCSARRAIRSPPPSPT